MMTLDFEELSFPVQDESLQNYSAGYSSPTPILSVEGVKEIRTIIENHKDLIKSSERQKQVIRGLAYKSKFIRDFIYDKTFLSHIRKMANKPLCPHSFGTHSVQVNIGSTEFSNAEVDKWHLDSVDFVLVIIVSDMEGMEGGELEILQMNLNGQESTEMLRRKGGPPRENVIAVSYA